MLIDEVVVTLKGGHGGSGKVSFNPGERGGPSGGNGGKGGDLYIEATTDITALKQFLAQSSIAAENGLPGDSNRKFGKDGKNKVIFLPLGTVLKDLKSSEEISLDKLDERILICRGGLGGRGNFEFKSPRNTTPEYSQSGLPGDIRRFQIHLKLIADFGLIGLPNAGKSSLLNALTETNVKTAEYPFTTLEPNLGTLNKKILADIPGLIEGASSGKGLGIKFLKHIEKTSVLMLCIDSQSEDVESDYKIVTSELKTFNSKLLEKPLIILLTKSDLVSKEDLRKKAKLLKKFNHKIYFVSIHDWDSLENLKLTIGHF